MNSQPQKLKLYDVYWSLTFHSCTVKIIENPFNNEQHKMWHLSMPLFCTLHIRYIYMHKWNLSLTKTFSHIHSISTNHKIYLITQTHFYIYWCKYSKILRGTCEYFFFLNSCFMQSLMIILAKILFNCKQNWNKPIIKMNFFKFHALMQSFMTILANIYY